MEQRSTQPDSTQHRQFNVGDRVRVADTDEDFAGERGVVLGADIFNRRGRFKRVATRLADGTVMWFHPDDITRVSPMSQPARTLLAAWHASNRTLARIDRPNSPNRANINWGMARRRYCTPDGSIDLTITTAVK